MKTIGGYILLGVIMLLIVIIFIGIEISDAWNKLWKHKT